MKPKSKLLTIILAVSLIAPILGIPILFGGCALRESSSQINYGPAHLQLPKDAQIGFLQVKTDGTNFEVRLTNCVFKMNPAVVDAATARDTALIKATQDAITTALGAAAAAGAKGVAP